MPVHRIGIAATVVFAACSTGCGSKPAGETSGSATKAAGPTATVAAATKPKPEATATPTSAAPNPTTPTVAAPLRIPTTQDIFVVSLAGGDGKTSPATINEQPVEPAQLQAAFAASWDDYAAARAKRKLTPILSLRVNEAEPVKPALAMLAHARLTKGCVVRLLGTEHHKDAAVDDPELGPVRIKLAKDPSLMNTQTEVTTVRSRADATGKLIGHAISTEYSRGIPGKPVDTKTLRGFHEIQIGNAFKAGQEVHNIEWIVDDALRGDEFLNVAFALSCLPGANKEWHRFGGLIMPRSASDPRDGLNADASPRGEILTIPLEKPPGLP